MVRIKFDRLIADMLHVWIVMADGKQLILPKNKTTIEGSTAIIPLEILEIAEQNLIVDYDNESTH
jgi:hypothetical protein